MNRRGFLAVAGAGVATLAGCTVGGLSDGDYDIGMSANEFLPQRYEIELGETVVWGNNGSRGHTVTAYDTLPDGASFFASGGFESQAEAETEWANTGAGNIPPGETFMHTFDVAGEHPYYCIPHEDAGMVGTIVVVD